MNHALQVGLITYASTAGGLTVMSLFASWVSVSEEQIPKRVAASILWPLALAAVVYVGAKQWLPTSDDKHAILSRKQQRQLTYERAQLALEECKTELLERNTRIIRGEEA